jgi:hypothetical protein
MPSRGRIARSDAEIDKQLEVLTELDLAGARWAWRQASGCEAPRGMSRNFLVRSLAYRIQARALGDLDRKHKRMLDRLAEGDLSVIAVTNGPGMNLEPGTDLVREYKGEHHRVAVTADGFSCNGITYPTLSAVARAITGSNWNGYVFFGLKAKSPRAGTKNG